jgi:4-amino-4-deoxy-L-arabinose transferase-like glycosyltransferase
MSDQQARERRRRCAAAALLGVLAYLAATMPRLGVFPPVGEDEPWIAAAPYKLATQGVLGSDLFFGYYGMERHHYAHMPIYPLAQAAIFKAFGVGVVQMRALPVACGLLLLLVVFIVGRQAGGDRVGALAVALMVTLRVTAGGAGTGILLLDRARINRYDIAVPVFGLAALWAFNRAERATRAAWYALTGVFAALASLSHLYGLFWLPVFAGLMIARHGRDVLRQKSIAPLLVGFACPWLPWLAFVASGWSDYLGQMRLVSARFDVFNPSFYVDNVLHGDGPISLDWSLNTLRTLPFARVGTWTMLAGCPAACATMLLQARHRSRDAGSSLAVAALAQTVMFVALLKVKTVSYMIALWPLWAVLLAWLGVWLWDRRRPALRVALLGLLAVIAMEAVTRVARAADNAKQTGAYEWFESEVAGCIPPGALVLGLQHYWLGLRQYPYRTWLLPIAFAQPHFYHEAMDLDAALARVNPDVILVDRYIDDLMRTAASPADANHALFVGFERFNTRRRMTLACVVKDRTYGTMQVYRVSSQISGRDP